MNATEVLRIVDSLHREKNIDKEIVFVAIESALVSAARKHFGEDADIEFIIERDSGQIAGRCGQEELDYELPKAAAPAFEYIPVTLHNGVAYVCVRPK